jgi:hypothetical protein
LGARARARRPDRVSRCPARRSTCGRTATTGCTQCRTQTRQRSTSAAACAPVRTDPMHFSPSGRRHIQSPTTARSARCSRLPAAMPGGRRSSTSSSGHRATRR